MTSSLRTVYRDVAVYSAGDVLLRASAIITLPVYTRVLSPTDYGVWAYATSAVTLLSAALAIGGDQAYSRFYFEARSLEEKQRLTSTWFAFLFVWSTGVVVAVLPLSATFSELAFGTRRWGLLVVLLLLTGPVTLMSILLGLVVRNDFKPALYMALNIALTVITVVLSLVFAVGLDWGIVGLAAGQLASMSLLLPVRVWYARHLLRRTFDTPLLRRVLRFALPLVPGTVAWWVFGFSDRLVLGWLSTLHELGLYSVANSTTTILGLLVSAVGLAWAPHALRMYEERKLVTPAFYGRMLTYTIVAFGILAVLVTTFAHELLVVVAGRDYAGAEPAVGPLALGFVAFATVQVTQMGMTVAKRTSYLALAAWVAALVNLALNIAFVPAYGMRASAWATFVAYLVLTCFYFVVSQRLWRIQVQTRKVALAAGVTFAFTVGVPALPDLGELGDVALKIAYVCAFAAVLVVTRVVERRELRRLVPRGTAT